MIVWDGHSHCSRGMCKGQGGATYANWLCATRNSLLIHVGKTPTTNRPVYVVPPECSSTVLTKEEWLLEAEKKARTPAGQLATPPYPWHRSPVQYQELLAAEAGQAPMEEPLQQPP